jgi:hypothetical protein
MGYVPFHSRYAIQIHRLAAKIVRYQHNGSNAPAWQVTYIIRFHLLLVFQSFNSVEVMN